MGPDGVCELEKMVRNEVGPCRPLTAVVHGELVDLLCLFPVFCNTPFTNL